MRATVIGIEWDLIPRPAYVVCDVCRDYYTAGVKFMLRSERARLAEALRSDGWAVIGDHERHICPPCAKES